MVQEVKCILANTSVQYEGDVTVLGGVGEHARLEVNGNLTIVGDVGNGAIIKVFKQAPAAQNMQTIYIHQVNSLSEYMNQVTSFSQSFEARKLLIQGKVGEGVEIIGRAAEIKIDGDIGNFSKITAHSGSVEVGAIGSKVEVTGHAASLKIKAANKGCRVVAHSGDVTVEMMNPESRLTGHASNVNVSSMGEKTQVTIHSGHLVLGALTDSSSVCVYHGLITLPEGSPYRALIKKDRMIQTLNMKAENIRVSQTTVTMYCSSQSSERQVLIKQKAPAEESLCCRIL